MHLKHPVLVLFLATLWLLGASTAVLAGCSVEGDQYGTADHHHAHHMVPDRQEMKPGVFPAQAPTILIGFYSASESTQLAPAFGGAPEPACIDCIGLEACVDSCVENHCAACTLTPGLLARYSFQPGLNGRYEVLVQHTDAFRSLSFPPDTPPPFHHL